MKKTILFVLILVAAATMTYCGKNTDTAKAKVNATLVNVSQ